MFTSLVSWLLVACVPGLLMLAALGLARLERELAREVVTSTAAGRSLDLAKALDTHTLAGHGMPEALEYHRRQAQRLPARPPAGRYAGPRHAAPMFGGEYAVRGEPGLPTRIGAHSRINPQFTETLRVDPV